MVATVPWEPLSLLQHRGEGAGQGGAGTLGTKRQCLHTEEEPSPLGCFLASAKVICLENQSLAFALSIPVKKRNRRMDLLRPAELGKP